MFRYATRTVSLAAIRVFSSTSGISHAMTVWVRQSSVLCRYKLSVVKDPDEFALCWSWGPKSQNNRRLEPNMEHDGQSPGEAVAVKSGGSRLPLFHDPPL